MNNVPRYSLPLAGMSYGGRPHSLLAWLMRSSLTLLIPALGQLSPDGIIHRRMDAESRDVWIHRVEDSLRFYHRQDVRGLIENTPNAGQTPSPPYGWVDRLT